MITALDTSVVLDVLIPDPTHGEASRRLLKDACDSGELVLCEVVYSELVPLFYRRFEESARAELEEFFVGLGVAHLPTDSEVAFEAGVRWHRYRAAGGPRERILADFLIGAHALLRADRFLTRDRGFYQTYYPDLTLQA